MAFEIGKALVNTIKTIKTQKESAAANTDAEASSAGKQADKNDEAKISIKDTTKTFLTTFKSQLHSEYENSLSNVVNSKFSDNELVKFAEGIHEAGIPSKILDEVHALREKVNTSGVVGQITSEVLNTVYQVGASLNIPVISTCISACADMFPADSVGKTINAQLASLEKHFFDKLENSDNVKQFKAEVLKTVSPENIANAAQARTIDFLETMIVATEEGKTIIDAAAEAKEHVLKRAENADGNFYGEKLTIDFVKDVAPELIKTTAEAAAAALKEPNTTALAKNAISKAPSATASIFNSMANLLKKRIL